MPNQVTNDDVIALCDFRDMMLCGQNPEHVMREMTLYFRKFTYRDYSESDDEFFDSWRWLQKELKCKANHRQMRVIKFKNREYVNKEDEIFVEELKASSSFIEWEVFAEKELSVLVTFDSLPAPSPAKP